MRQWPNVISGWFIGAGVPTLIFLYDPLGVHSVWPEPGQGIDRANSIVIAVALTIGLGGYAIFGRPSVTFLEDRLVLRNVLRKVSIPYRAIEEIDSMSSAHLRIRADGRWHRAWGLERTNAAMITGRRGIAGTAEDRIHEYTERSRDTNENGVRVAVRGVGIIEVLLIAAWLTYLVLGLTTGIE